MPAISLAQYLYYVLVRRVWEPPFLNHVDYDKAEVKKVLTRETGWRDYGGKHNETVWTRYFQFVLKKFGLTTEEFEAILQAPPKKATDYPSNHFLFDPLGRLKNVFRHTATSP